MATKRSCHFQDSWIVEFEQDGIDRSEIGNTFARCKLCKTDFSIMNSGRSHVTAHLRTACHTRNRCNLDASGQLTDNLPEDLGGTSTNSYVRTDDTPIETDVHMARESVKNNEIDAYAVNHFTDAKNGGFDFLTSISSRLSSSGERKIRRSRRMADVQTNGERALRDARLQLLHLQAERTRLEIEKLKNETLLVSIELENAAMKRTLLRDQLQKAGHQFRFDAEVNGHTDAL